MEDPSKNLYICTTPSPERTHTRTHAHTHTHTHIPSLPLWCRCLPKQSTYYPFLAKISESGIPSYVSVFAACQKTETRTELDLSDPPGYKLSEHTHEHYIVVIELF